MGVRFNIDEVLAMAAQIERNGGTFYRAAAAGESSPEGKDLLLKIAEQEDCHLALFERMREQVSGPEVELTAFDPYGEAVLYLKAMADGHVFDLRGDDPTKILKGDETLEDIIRIALQAEKDSIAFFVGLKDLIPANMGNEKIDDLIREEMIHIRWLNDQLS
ncbi:MAG: ferritin family protein [Kiritimatiellia bacterium]|jgi:rubrerythrin|nr:ferritin family protein [Kiritimatiellia bacterium]MDP6847181.1 ferritin family protein [Kiritimatiellia bacterium]